jgi:hypothetical protein
MSENIPSGNGGGAGGDADKKDQVSYESYQKLLSQKKKLDSEYEQMKARMNEYEQGKLEAEGKLKEAYENQKKLTQESENKFKSLFQNVAQKNLKTQFKMEAEKLGCVDADLAYLATDFSDVDISADLEFDPNKISEKLQNLSKSKPLLFKKDAKLPNDLNPSGGSSNQDLKSMKTEDLIKLI